VTSARFEAEASILRWLRNWPACLALYDPSATFRLPQAWSYVQAHPPFDIAGEWPDELLAALSAPQAFEAARNAPARRVLLDLRSPMAASPISMNTGATAPPRRPCSPLSVRAQGTGRSPA